MQLVSTSKLGVLTVNKTHFDSYKLGPLWNTSEITSKALSQNHAISPRPLWAHRLLNLGTQQFALKSTDLMGLICALWNLENSAFSASPAFLLMLLPTLFAVAPPLLCFFPFIFRCKSPTSGKKGMQSSGPRSFLHLFLDKAASGNPSRPCLRPHLARLRPCALVCLFCMSL